jgi:hypothetical protein
MGRFLTFDETRSPTIRLVHDHWASVRRGRSFPDKRDIDPAAFKPALPYVMIAELHRDPVRVFYRLVGTAVAHFAGEDFTGKWLHDLDWGQSGADIQQYYVRMLETGEPTFGIDNFIRASDGLSIPFEWAVFPLSSDNRSIDHCLAVEDYRNLDWTEAPQRVK